MTKDAYKLISLFTNIRKRVLELHKHCIDDEAWNEAAAIYRFCELAASLTKTQSEPAYVTLDITSMAYESPLTQRTCVIEVNDSIHKPVVEEICSKIMKYEKLICSDTAQLALVLDIMFGSNLLQTADLLHWNVSIDALGELNEKTSDSVALSEPARNFHQINLMRTHSTIFLKTKSLPSHGINQ